jgi:hypothetical protein
VSGTINSTEKTGFEIESRRIAGRQKQNSFAENFIAFPPHSSGLCHA